MNLQQLLARVRELDKNATPGPFIIQRFDWESGDINYQIETDDITRKDIVFASVLNKKANAELIAEYRTLCVKLADIVEIQDKALEKLKNGAGNNMAGWKQTWAHEYAKEAQSQVDALIGGLSD